MKTVKLISFLFFISLSIFASNNQEVLKFNAKIGFTNGEETIVAHKFIDGGRKILLIGEKNLQIWDVEGGKLLHFVPHQIPQFSPRGFFSTYILLGLPQLLDWRPFIVDPEGKWLITAEKSGSGQLRSAVARDLRDLKQIAVLDLPAGVSTEYVSFDETKNEIHTFGKTDKRGAFAVWDKDTFRLKKSFSVNEYKWHQFIENDSKILVGSGDTKIVWSGTEKQGENLTLRDARTGAVEKEFTAPGLKPKSPFKATTVSRDERFLMAERDGRIFVWEIDGDGSPRFEVFARSEKEDVKLAGVIGGRFFAVSVDKKLAVYDFAGDGTPVFVLASATPNDSVNLLDKTKDGRFIVVADDTKVSVLETASGGKSLYEIERDSVKERFTLVKFLEEKNYLAVGRVNRSEDKPERTEIYDIQSGRLRLTIPAGFSANVEFTPNEKFLFDERLGGTLVWNFSAQKSLYIPLEIYEDEYKPDEVMIPISPYNIEHTSLSPDGKFVLKYGDDVVSVFDMETGKEVQKLFDPERVKFSKKTKEVKKSGLGKAGWSDDGKFVYAIGEKSRTVNFWKVSG